MKKHISLLIALTGIISLNAQDFRFGITGGMNLNSITNERNKVDYNLKANISSKKINWETPYYAHIGDKDKLGNMWSANLHYLNIPIHIGYMMPVSKKISLFMNAGPYWGVGLFGKYTMTSGDKDTTIAENIFKDYLKRFDCGIGWNRY